MVESIKEFFEAKVTAYKELEKEAIALQTKMLIFKDDIEKLKPLVMNGEHLTIVEPAKCLPATLTHSDTIRRMHNKNAVTQDEINQFIKDFNNGMSCVEIAQKYGWDDSTVSRHIKASRGGLNYYNITKHIPQEILKKSLIVYKNTGDILKLKQQGTRTKDIAKKYGVSEATIYKLCAGKWPLPAYKKYFDDIIAKENTAKPEIGRGISFLNYYKNDVERRKDLALYNSIQYIKGKFANGASTKSLAQEFKTIEYRIEQILKDQWPEPELIPVMKGDQS